MREREWMLGNSVVDELFEYKKNLGVLKNYVSSFSSSLDDNIGMIFSSYFNRGKTSPLIYVKFWREACLPCLLFGTELFTLNASQLIKVKRCQQWFLKNVFYFPVFAPTSLLLRFSGLNSIEAEIDLKMLIIWWRLINEPVMAENNCGN